MGNARPVKMICFEKFLKWKGCKFIGTNTHYKWKCPGCLRSITLQGSEKEVPFFHIQSNLKTMGVSTQDFWSWVTANC